MPSLNSERGHSECNVQHLGQAGTAGFARKKAQPLRNSRSKPPLHFHIVPAAALNVANNSLHVGQIAESLHGHVRNFTIDFPAPVETLRIKTQTAGIIA